MAIQDGVEKGRGFVVVMQALSAARLPEGERVTMHQFPSPLGAVEVTFRTRYGKEGFEAAVPGSFGLRCEVEWLH